MLKNQVFTWYKMVNTRNGVGYLQDTTRFIPVIITDIIIHVHTEFLTPWRLFSSVL